MVFDPGEEISISGAASTENKRTAPGQRPGLWLLLRAESLSLWRSVIFLIRSMCEVLARLSFGNLPPLVGVAAVVERDGKILMLVRCDGLGQSLPGGIMRWNENVMEALRREVLEETGYRIGITGLVGIYSGPDRDPRFSSVAIVYSAVVIDGLMTDSWEGRVVWIDRDKLPDVMAFDHRQAIADYLASKVRVC